MAGKGSGVTKFLESVPIGKRFIDWMDNAIDDAFPSSNALSTVTTKESNIPPLREASEATPTTYVLNGVQITKKQYNNLDIEKRKTVNVTKGLKAEVAKNPMFKVQGIPTSKGEESYLTTQLEAFGIDPLSPRAIDITRSQTDTLSDVYQNIDFDLGETLEELALRPEYNLSPEISTSIKKLMSDRKTSLTKIIKDFQASDVPFSDDIYEGFSGTKYFQSHTNLLSSTRKKLLTLLNKELNLPTNNLQKREYILDQIDAVDVSIDELKFKENSINKKYGFDVGRSGIENPAIDSFGGDKSQLIGTPFEESTTQFNVQLDILDEGMTGRKKYSSAPSGSKELLNFYSPTIATILRGNFNSLKAKDIVPYILKQQDTGVGTSSRINLEQVDRFLKNNFTIDGADGLEIDIPKDTIVDIINSFEPKFTSYVEDNTFKISKLRQDYINNKITKGELDAGIKDLANMSSIRYMKSQRQDLLTETKWFKEEDLAKDRVLYNNKDFDNMSYVDVDALFKTLTPPNIIKDLSGTTAFAKDANYFNIVLNAEELNINFQTAAKGESRVSTSTNRIPQSLSSKTNLTDPFEQKRVEELAREIKDLSMNMKYDTASTSREGIIRILDNPVGAFFNTNLQIEKTRGLNIFKSKNLFSNKAILELVSTTKIPDANVEKGVALQRLKKNLKKSLNEDDDLVSLEDIRDSDFEDIVDEDFPDYVAQLEDGNAVANLPEPLINDGLQKFADDVNALGLNENNLLSDTLKLNELSLGVINSKTNPSNRMLGLLDKIYTEKYNKSAIETIYETTGLKSKNNNRKQITILQDPKLLKSVELELENKVTGKDINNYLQKLNSDLKDQFTTLQNKNYRKPISIPTHTDTGDIAHLRGSILDTDNDKILLVEELQSDLFTSMQKRNTQAYVSPEKFESYRIERDDKYKRIVGEKFKGIEKLEREQLISSVSQYVEKLIQSAIVYGKKQGVTKIVVPNWEEIAVLRGKSKKNEGLFKMVYEDTVKSVFKKFSDEIEGINVVDKFFLTSNKKVQRSKPMVLDDLLLAAKNIKAGKATAEDYSTMYQTKKSLALDISDFEFNVGDVDVLGTQSTDTFLTLKTRAKEGSNKDVMAKATKTADTLINTIKRQNRERKQYPLVGRYNKGGLMVNPKSRVN
tara:strand:- start:11 stop:3466 length:3456 start_codon:yes stop_codon:yes gene_type:complete